MSSANTSASTSPAFAGSRRSQNPGTASYSHRLIPASGSWSPFMTQIARTPTTSQDQAHAALTAHRQRDADPAAASAGTYCRRLNGGSLEAGGEREVLRVRPRPVGRERHDVEHAPAGVRPRPLVDAGGREPIGEHRPREGKDRRDDPPQVEQQGELAHRRAGTAPRAAAPRDRARPTRGGRRRRSRRARGRRAADSGRRSRRRATPGRRRAAVVRCPRRRGSRARPSTAAAIIATSGTGSNASVRR